MTFQHKTYFYYMRLCEFGKALAVFICFMPFYSMGKGYNELKLSRWVTISRGILGVAITTCDKDLALLSLLYPIHIVIPSFKVSRTILHMRNEMWVS